MYYNPRKMLYDDLISPKEIFMSDSMSPKPLNVAERQSTIEEFTYFCHEEKERRMNSGETFDEALYEEAKELALRKLQILEDEGWV